MPFDLQLYGILVLLAGAGLVMVFRKERRDDQVLIMNLNRLRETENEAKLLARLEEPIYDWDRQGM